MARHLLEPPNTNTKDDETDRKAGKGAFGVLDHRRKRRDDQDDVTSHGECLIVDPAQTITRIFLYFYFMINVGALVGSIAMVYAEKYVGFWLSFLLPTAMFAFCPVVLVVCRRRYNLTPPTGSVVGKAFRLWTFAMKPHWSWNPRKLSVLLS